MDRKLVSIVLFSLQMTKSNDLPFFQLVMRSKWRHYQFNNDEKHMHQIIPELLILFVLYFSQH